MQVPPQKLPWDRFIEMLRTFQRLFQTSGMYFNHLNYLNKPRKLNLIKFFKPTNHPHYSFCLLESCIIDIASVIIVILIPLGMVPFLVNDPVLNFLIAMLGSLFTCCFWALFFQPMASWAPAFLLFLAAAFLLFLASEAFSLSILNGRNSQICIFEKASRTSFYKLPAASKAYQLFYGCV